LVDGRPMGVGSNGKLSYRDLPKAGFTLEAYRLPGCSFP
jgi:hypothetical protein